MTALLINFAATLLPNCCRIAPSINILGAFFPDWMLCIVAAVLLTILSHHLLNATGLGMLTEGMTSSILYLSLVALFAVVGWFVFFQN